MPYKSAETRRLKAPEYFRRWRLKNKNYDAERHRAYRAKNGERVRRQQRESYARRKAKIQLQRALGVGPFSEEYRRKARVYAKQWRANNPELCLIYGKKAKARRRGSVRSDGLINSVIHQWKKTSRFKCFYCGSVFSARLLHIDHVQPVSKQGGHTVSNICKACPDCNRSKGAKDIGGLVIGGQIFLI